jgi:hypothetical protein
MRRSIGFLVLLWGVSQFFTSAFEALDGAARESFKLVEVSAVTSQQKIADQQTK